MARALPTTVRIGLLAGLLALASNVAVVGFIHWRTNSQLLDALEDSLPIAVALAVLLGLVCGGIVARYVGGRVRSIATVADRVTAGDFAQRVRPSQSRDAFDRLGEQLNQMLDRIGALMDELRMVTDSLAHDLRSPVSRLRSAAHSAAETADPAERDQQLASVVRQADSLTRILTTVLEISRSEALTSRSQFSGFDVGALGAELSEMYEPVAEEAGAALRLRRPEQPIELFGHRQLIAQAVSNLVENAIRYGAAGEAIEVTVGDDGRQLSIAVADHGPGIPAERREEALRRFGRLDSSRSHEGAGLGLALARAIAHLHGGELTLEDNDPGLIAVLRLPRRRDGADAASTPG